MLHHPMYAERSMFSFPFVHYDLICLVGVQDKVISGGKICQTVDPLSVVGLIIVGYKKQC